MQILKEYYVTNMKDKRGKWQDLRGMKLKLAICLQ
jgi:hypothetical protein